MEVEAILKKHNVNCDVGFGLYYSDPKTVPKEDLRWLVGNVVTEAEAKALDGVEGLEAGILQGGTKIGVHMPCRTMLSIIVNIMRVYPKSCDYIVPMEEEMVKEGKDRLCAEGVPEEEYGITEVYEKNSHDFLWFGRILPLE
ncbi:hypothetical protein KIPB_001643 [Kipferlia bialata]|uniref:Uncharacterized protein n=1 Tax=Kipferlia bialata TaxID=797122 RepID=A0A9K3GFB3_9EUKA|nr:hypothetical protein KIPB_001643 [Kipferlia bialata]|eukprot:g1643.t1